MRRGTEQCKPPAAGSEGIGCVSAAGELPASGPSRTGVHNFCFFVPPPLVRVQYRWVHHRAYDSKPTRYNEGVIVLFRAGCRVPPPCTGMTTYGAASHIGQAHIGPLPATSSTRVLNLRFLSYNASYVVASNICRALLHGSHAHERMQYVENAPIDLFPSIYSLDS